LIGSEYVVRLLARFGAAETPANTEAVS